MDSQDPNPPGQTRDQQRRANRKLLYALLMMTAGAFAFGWALVPLYGVLCKVAGIGNVQAKEGQAVVHEAIDPNREVTIEFVADPASVGSYEFRPPVASIRGHPGKIYATEVSRNNL